MDHASLVSILKRSCDLCQQATDEWESQPVASAMQRCHVFREWGTGDVFHHQVGLIVDRIEVEHLHDVGMAQLCDCARLELESLERLQPRVICIEAAQDLDSHFALQGGMRA